MIRYSAGLGTATLVLATLAFAPLTAQAEDRCASPKGSVEARACAMAAAGPDSLRRFIERTQGIYILYYYDYARPNA